MPSVSSGTIAPAEAALFAASGPARPAMAPLPNFSGFLETDFSTLYDISDATGRAGAWGGADEEAEERAADDRASRLAVVLPGRPEALERAETLK